MGRLPVNPTIFPIDWAWAAKLLAHHPYRSKGESTVAVFRVFASLLLLVCIASNVQAADDPLPSWNDGAAKTAIVDFVKTTTTEGSPNFVAPEERIATFDNDGTLWIEQPMYNQFVFALDEVKATADQHPEWKEKEPFKSVLAGDMKAVAAMGQKGMLEIVAATHSGMTTVDFNKSVKQWLETAKHPRFKVAYTDLVYQPMLELLAYLRANGFKTFIVSGGGVEFMRNFADKTYGIPPEQVIGSSGVTQYQMQDASPVLIKQPKVLFVDDGPGKPEGINHFIGRQPIFAFGNSDGDKEMLEWTAACKPLCFMGLVHHTDGEREYAYDRKSDVGKLDKALDEALDKGWTVVDMKKDWKTIFPFEKSAP
jgi:phosphoglycolate phosphatase-like HAD superfamily hydrolase